MELSESAFHTRPSLLLRIRDPRDQAAWTSFVELYTPLVYRHCRRQGLQDADAADVAQEVMTQMARSAADFEYRPRLGRFRDWLGVVTRSKLADHGRARRRSVPLVAADPGLVVDPGAGWRAEFDAHVLRAALDRARPHFEPVTWRAFELVWLEDRPAPDTAHALGVPVSAVYVAKSRVLRRLHEEIVSLAADLPGHQRG